MRKDFEQEKQAVASRFDILEDELNQKIDQLKQVSERRFMDVAKAMAGMSSASGQELAQQLAERSAFLAQQAAKAATVKELMYQAIAQAMGVNVDVAKVALNARENDLLKILVDGIAVSSFDVLTEVFKTLNPNQNNRPFYDVAFQQQVAGQCQGQVQFTPFTNIVGRDTHEILAIAYMRLLLGGVRSSNVAHNEVFFGVKGVVSSNPTQQALLARLFDYRANPAEEVSGSCLNAIDQFAREMILNNTQFGSYRQQLVRNLTLQRMANLLADDGQKVFNIVGAVHAIMASSPSANLSTGNLMTVVNRLVETAIAQRVYHLVNLEVENMIAIQRELSEQNGFQAEFNRYLLAYRDQMAAFRTGLEQQRVALAQEIATRQAQNQAIQSQLTQFRDAMGYVAALALTNPLASEEIRRKVSAAANIDASIHNLMNQIINNRNAVEQPFTPVVRAIRHVTKGNLQCFGTQVSAGSLPSGSAFVGSWGVSNLGNAPFFPGDSCAANFRNAQQAAQLKDRVIYRVWGSLHKLELRSTINSSVIRSIDFRQAASMSFPIRRIADGHFAQGVFDAQVAGILDPVVAQGWAFNTGVIQFTPIYVASSGAETRGSPQTYSMTLYSPIVLDFMNKGEIITIAPDQSPVWFDLAQLGQKQQVGWITGRDNGLLALDLNGNNRIDHGGELFGEFTMNYQTGVYAHNGYEALAQYDMNKDDVIDAKDPMYHKLVVWFDRNTNGISEKDELISLAQAKVSKIGLSYQELPESRQWNQGNRIRYSAKFFGPAKCGQTGCNSYDIYFGTAWRDQTAKVLSQK